MFRSATIAVVEAAAMRIVCLCKMAAQPAPPARRQPPLCFMLVAWTGEIAAEPSEDSRVMPPTNYLSYRRRPKKIHGFLPQNEEAACATVRAERDFRRRAGSLIMAQERDDLVYLAKLAEQAERFDEMVERRRWTHIRRAAA